MMTTLKRSLAALIALIALALPAFAEPCRDLTFDRRVFTVCEAQANADLRLWLTAPDGRPYGTFNRLRNTVEPGATLAFAMNAGMYHPDRRPVGLYIEEGAEAAPLVRRAGPGNFGLLPNGLFCVADTGYAVLETLAYDAAPTPCRFATQSGPMLVIDGALHPRFLADATSRNYRNGVGVSADGQTAYFAISGERVTFHEFARLFRDALSTPNALYFDGRISRLYAPNLGRDDGGFPMGPIVGLLTPPR